MSRYAVRPRADRDLDEQADYYAAHGSHGLGHRFLIAAHDTFAHLASQPGMGWRFKFKRSGLESIRVFPVSGFVRILTTSKLSSAVRSRIKLGRGRTIIQRS